MGALEQAATDVGVTLTLDSTINEQFAAAVEAATSRIGAEALLDVARHAGTCEAQLTLDLVDDDLVLRVQDKGSGTEGSPVGVGDRSNARTG